VSPVFDTLVIAAKKRRDELWAAENTPTSEAK
jgi:hypothetical protein